MSLPRKVREQEALADSLLQQAYQQSTAVAEPPAETVVEEPPQEPPQAPVAVEPQPTKDHDDDSYRKKYEVLSGKYSSEVPRLAAELRDLKFRLEERDRELEELKKRPQQTLEALVKPEEISEYGEGLVDLIRRAAREEVQAKEAEISDLKAQIKNLSNQQAKTLEVDFYTILGSLVPDWMELNENEDFLRWLGEPDSLTGIARQELLTDAERKHDAKRAANFFNTWKQQTTKRVTEAQKNLEAQVTPSPVQTTVAPQGKMIWTRAQIQEFYRQARQGSIDPKRAAEIESDIHAASMEGRIR